MVKHLDIFKTTTIFGYTAGQAISIIEIVKVKGTKGTSVVPKNLVLYPIKGIVAANLGTAFALSFLFALDKIPKTRVN